MGGRNLLCYVRHCLNERQVILLFLARKFATQTILFPGSPGNVEGGASGCAGRSRQTGLGTYHMRLGGTCSRREHHSARSRFYGNDTINVVSGHPIGERTLVF